MPSNPHIVYQERKKRSKHKPKNTKWRGRIKMARLNSVSLIGTVVNENLDPRTVDSEKTDGKQSMAVLNFLVRCFDETLGRYNTLPVAVWGEREILDCMNHLNKGDMVYVQGELRYKFIYNTETKKHERIYTTVKASTVEFISKKLKGESLAYSMNEVKLIGNLVQDPTETEDGFVIAVDRLYPSKEVKVPNYKLTDYVTLVMKDKKQVMGNLKKGSVAIVSGKLMSRKLDEDVVKPRIVVEVDRIVGK